MSVAAYDRDEEVLAVAAERGAVDVTAASLEEALMGAELAVAAVPVAQLGATVRAMLEASSEGCAVTDVGSTKAAVCAAASPSSRFVGGHPLTGAETSGPARQPGLVRGRFLVSDSDRRDRPGLVPTGTQLRCAARCDPGRDRPTRARPPRCADEPPAARSRTCSSTKRRRHGSACATLVRRRRLAA